MLKRAAMMAAVAAALSAAPGMASDYWDPFGAGSPGGSGVWDTSSLQWSTSSTGGSDFAWPNSTSGTVAEFGGAGGAVTLNSNSTPLYASGLIFDSNYTINGPALGTSNLFLAGNAPSISIGSNTVSINANLNGTLGFTQSGAGTLNLGGNNSGLSGTIALNGNVNLTSSAAGSSSAKWSLNGGTLSYNPTAGGAGKTVRLGAFVGSGILTNSGTAGTSDTITYSIGALGSSTTFAGSITDSAAGDHTAIAVTGNSTLTLTGASSFTGAAAVQSAEIILEGAAGSFNGAAAISLSGSGSTSSWTFGILDVTNGVGGNNNNRVPDTAPITLNTGEFFYTGQPSGNSTETIGAITSSGGYNLIAVYFEGSNTAVVTAASLNRPAFGGTVVVVGAFLGMNDTATSSISRLLLTTAPTLVGGGAITTTDTPTEQNTPIIPYAVGFDVTESNGFNTFLTYSPTGGVRPLSLTNEYTTNSIASGNNTLITSTTTAASSASINSLDILDAPLTLGAGVNLTIASGAMLLWTGSAINSASSSSPGTLSFNGGEAILNILTFSGGITTPASISANLANLTGLTVSGSTELLLTQNTSTTDTAPVYIQGGTLVVSKDADLGYATGNSAITFPVGSIGELGFTGSGFTTSKGISLLGPGIFYLNQTTDSGTVAGLVSGPGTLQMTGSGKLTLSNTANTYTGNTSIGSGTLALAANVTNNIASSPLILVGPTSSSSTAVLDATQLTAAGGFQLSSGQTLAGFGTVKAPTAGLVVASGSTISAGDGVSTPGNLTTTGKQVWNGGGTYDWKINLSSPGTAGSFNTAKTGSSWDELTMSSLDVAASSGNPFNIQIVGVNPNIGSGTFNPAGSYSWVAANMPTGQASGNLTNAFALSYSGFADFNVTGSFRAYLDSTDDPGFTDLVISYTALPEPGSFSLLGIGAASLILRRRPRRRHLCAMRSTP